ncbi:MAG: hypothetical protein ACJ8C4_14090 [Gemmataceae bacterium]
MNAEDIMLAMARMYAACNTYRDTGRVVTRFVDLSGKVMHSAERPFSTAFIRPDRFRFEFRNQFHNRGKWYRNIVW